MPVIICLIIKWKPQSAWCRIFAMLFWDAQRFEEQAMLTVCRIPGYPTSTTNQAELALFLPLSSWKGNETRCQKFAKPAQEKRRIVEVIIGALYRQAIQDRRQCKPLTQASYPWISHILCDARTTSRATPWSQQWKHLGMMFPLLAVFFPSAITAITSKSCACLLSELAGNAAKISGRQLGWTSFVCRDNETSFRTPDLTRDAHDFRKPTV